MWLKTEKLAQAMVYFDERKTGVFRQPHGKPRCLYQQRCHSLITVNISFQDTKPHRTFPFSEILDALEYDLPTNRYNPTLASAASSPPHPSTADDADDAHRTHSFKIVTTKRTLLLCAPSEEEEIRWLGAVRALIARRTDAGVVPGESTSTTSPDIAPSSSGGLKGKARRRSVNADDGNLEKKS
jgi:hypothetical protein